MLRTSDEHELSAYPFGYDDGDGVKMWHVVSLELPAPYFFVAHAVKEGKGWLYETCLFWRKADVLNFCRDVGQDAERKILQVSMLFPTDGVECWRMEDLKEIWRDPDVESVHTAIFVARDGRHLGRGHGGKGTVWPAARERIFYSPLNAP